MNQRLFWGLLILATVVCAQRQVDPRNTYHRVICVVPFTGSGTVADPKRPLYAPAPTAVGSQPALAPATGRTAPTAAPAAIIAYMHVASDDGMSAIVEFVANDMAAFSAILNDKSIKVFIKGKDSRDTIETALKKYKKDFNLDKFGVVVP